MVRGLYTASSSMLCEIIRQDMVANNLANVDTAGFKRDQGIFKELPTMKIKRVNDGELYPPRPIHRNPTIGEIGTGVVLDEVHTDWSAGKMEYTGHNLDLAIDDDHSFFVVQGPNGLRFSRDGVLRVNHEGFLVNTNGDYIMGQSEPSAPASRETIINEDGTTAVEMNPIRFEQLGQLPDIQIDNEGRVFVDGEPEFRVVTGTPFDRQALRKEGGNNFRREYGQVVRGEGNIKSGHREKPNFSLVEEMVKMIEVARAYESNAKVVEAHDSLLDRAINQVGTSRR